MPSVCLCPAAITGPQRGLPRSCRGACRLSHEGLRAQHVQQGIISTRCWLLAPCAAAGGSAAVAPAAPPWHVSQCCLFFSNPLCARVFCAQSATLCFALFFARLCSCALVVRTEFLIACGATRKETCSTGHHRESCTTVQRRFDMMLAWCGNSTGSRYISTVLKSLHHNILFFASVLDFCSNLLCDSSPGGMTQPNMAKYHSPSIYTIHTG